MKKIIETLKDIGFVFAASLLVTSPMIVIEHYIVDPYKDWVFMAYILSFILTVKIAKGDDNKPQT